MRTANPGDATSLVDTVEAHPKRDVAVKRSTDPAAESNATTYGDRLVESLTIQPGVQRYVMPDVSPRTLGLNRIEGDNEHAE